MGDLVYRAHLLIFLEADRRFLFNRYMNKHFNILYKSHYPWTRYISRYTHLALSLSAQPGVDSLLFIEPMRFMAEEPISSGFKNYKLLNGYTLTRERPLAVYTGINPFPFRTKLGLFASLSRKWEERSIDRLTGLMGCDTNPVALIQGPTEFSEKLLDQFKDAGFFTVFDWANLYEKDSGSKAVQSSIALRCRTLSRKADLVIAVSDQIRDLAWEWNSHAYTLRDAVPAKFTVQKPKAPRKERFHKPVIAYFGLINPTKLDYNLIKSVARLRPEWEFAYIGPLQGSTHQFNSDLPSNVRLISPMEGEALHAYLRAKVDLTFIPYNVEDIVAYYCSPLKLYEALAHGLGVVSTITFDPADAEPFISRANDAGELVGLMEAALESDSLEKRHERIAYAKQNTWEGRAEEFLSLVSWHFHPTARATQV